MTNAEEYILLFRKQKTLTVGEIRSRLSHLDLSREELIYLDRYLTNVKGYFKFTENTQAENLSRFTLTEKGLDKISDILKDNAEEVRNKWGYRLMIGSFVFTGFLTISTICDVANNITSSKEDKVLLDSISKIPNILQKISATQDSLLHKDLESTFQSDSIK
jgi:hypothetical protein